MMITSKANVRIKAIRKLRERKERRTSQLAYVEGIRPVLEAFQTNAGIEQIVLSPDLITSGQGQQMVNQARSRNIEILEVTPEVFKYLSVKDDPQGIAAIVRQRWKNLDSIEMANGDIWIALVDVADPGNLGTIMRTMDAVGGKGVILLENTTDPFDLTAIRASMGAVFSMDLVSTDPANLEIWKRKNQVTIIGAAGSASLDYQDLRYPDRLILMMGSERQGLSPKHLIICDYLVRIPMIGRSDSLNLGVASAVILYEIFNQKRSKNEAL